MAELERIDLLVQGLVHEVRRTTAVDPTFLGLCITEMELDALLARPCGVPPWANPNPNRSTGKSPALRAAIANISTQLEARRNASRAAGVPLRLDELARLFHLDDISIGILLICLAPEMDLRYEKLYAYLQDDVTRKRPSIDLILNLLCGDYGEKLAARSRFSLGSPLRDFRLIELLEDPSQPDSPLLRKFCRVDPRIVNFLLKQDGPDDCLRDVTYLRPANVNLQEVPLPDATKAHCLSFLQRARNDRTRVAIYLQAAPGSGQSIAAQAWCRNLSAGVLEADVRRLLQRAEPDFKTSVHLVIRESWLRRAAVYWRNFDAVLAPDKTAEKEFLLRQIEDRLGLTFLGGENVWEPDEGQLAGLAYARIEFPGLGYPERLALWERLVPAEHRTEDANLADISSGFRLTMGNITAAAATARHLARWRDAEKPLVSAADLQAACRLHSNRQLGTLARKIEPRHTLDDIVLPTEQRAQLQEILAQARLGHVVYGDWGFGRKLSYGKGLNALFSGPPGTGKTMAAQVLASELNLDLYQIDLSQVVSKYIGETEKNLNQVFREAQGSNAILFFDEADALFGKRSETKDAHDRYANIEVGYLLQKMEEYEGIAILATNLRNNLDDAFIRRLHVIIDFPFPDEEYRRRLWEVAFPSETPLGEDVDFGALARDIRLAGGNIKNIALTAAFYAANNGKVVRMPHLINAAQREHQKMGRTWIEAEARTPIGNPD